MKTYPLVSSLDGTVKCEPSEGLPTSDKGVSLNLLGNSGLLHLSDSTSEVGQKELNHGNSRGISRAALG